MARALIFHPGQGSERRWSGFVMPIGHRTHEGRIHALRLREVIVHGFDKLPFTGQPDEVIRIRQAQTFQLTHHGDISLFGTFPICNDPLDVDRRTKIQVLRTLRILCPDYQRDMRIDPAITQLSQATFNRR